MGGWGGAANRKQGPREEAIQIPKRSTLRWRGRMHTQSWG